MEENNHEQLEKILNSISQDAKPDKNFEQMLKVRLRERFYTQYEAPKNPFLKRMWRFKTLVTSTIVLALFSTTTIYAYNNDSVTNGSILYPLKRSTENVEELLATTPQAKTDHYNKMAKRRMRELAILENRGVIDQATIRETDRLLAKASTVAMEVEDEADEKNNSDESIEMPRQIKSAPIMLIKQNTAETREVREVKEVKEIREVKLVEEKRPEVRSRREKALEEISKTREEFDEKFNKKEKTERREKNDSER